MQKKSMNALAVRFGLEEKLSMFESSLTELELRRFKQLKQEHALQIAKEDPSFEVKSEVNASLAAKLEAFQGQLTEQEVEEMITLLTVDMVGSQSSFGAKPRTGSTR